MRQNPVFNTVFVLGNVVTSIISAIPLYLIAEAAAEKALSVPVLPQINGGICMVVTVPLTFTFIHSDVNSIPEQWHIANKRGKALIVGSYALAFPAGGLLNTYFMTGHPIIKVIASLIPCFLPRALITEWALRIRLSLNSKYQPAHHAYRLLRILSLNLKYNDKIKDQFTNDQYQDLAKSLNQATTSLVNLTNVVTKLNLLYKNNSIFVITDLQMKHPKYGKYIAGTIFSTIIALGVSTCITIYWGLANDGAACVFGSQFENNFDGNNITCPISSPIGEQIGYAFGYLTFTELNLTTIFPMLALFDMVKASANNNYTRSRLANYFLSVIAAACRVSVVAFMVNQKTDGLNSLLYVGLVIFIYNFVSTAILGPRMLKAIKKTVTDTGKQIKQYCFGSEESQPLIENENNIERAVANTEILLFHCLFQPERVSNQLESKSVKNDNTNSIDLTYT